MTTKFNNAEAIRQHCAASRDANVASRFFMHEDGKLVCSRAIGDTLSRIVTYINRPFVSMGGSCTEWESYSPADGIAQRFGQHWTESRVREALRRRTSDKWVHFNSGL